MADDYAQTIPKQEFGPMGGRDRVHMTLHDTTANPGPLGLMAFGLTTVLLNVHNAGLIPLSGIILAMGMFYGGLAQIIAGIMEWRKNSTFGMTAFLSFGFFWLTFVGIFAFPSGSAQPASSSALRARLSATICWHGACSPGSCTSPRCASTARCRPCS